MGNKIGRASTSKLRHGLDLFLADPADSPIFDDQTVSDTLETGAFQLSDHSTGDSRDTADKDAEDHGTTNTIQVRQAKATLDEMTKRLPELDRDQPEAAHVSWTQRVLSWFSRH